MSAASRPGVRLTGMAAVYVLLAAVYTHPLLLESPRRIANDPYDPVLNASILWWNAQTLPFSPAWWTPPHFYPVQDIAAFTENLAGISVLASPVQWAFGNPLFTYNLALFLSWPLSAIAACLLVFVLTRRLDAAFVAGLAFGFAPYRIGQIPHIQVVSAYWLPLAFVAMHQYLCDRRARWLVLFGAAWILQSLTNGYFMLFGAVLLALWLGYFGSALEARAAAARLAAVWIAASLPLAPVFLKYRAVHDQYGLSRSVGEAIGYSAEPWAFTQISRLVWFWYPTFGDTNPEVNLFPGLTAIALVVIATSIGVVRALRAARVDEPGRATRARRVAGAVALVAIAAAALVLVSGPVRLSLAGLTIRMSDMSRALLVATVSGALWFALDARARAYLRRRDALPFYAGLTVLIAVFCLGPQIRLGGRVLLDPAPYRLLMYLPGFEGLRVPPRFWMLGALTLAAAAGLAFARVVPAAGLVRGAALAAAAAGVLLDCWIRVLPMADAPVHWPKVERRDLSSAIIELPLGPPWDAAATFRALRHGRRVVNGVSGHDPPHYAPLQGGLNAYDPDVLLALASLGPLEAVVDASQDRGGRIAEYVSRIAGVDAVRSDGVRTAYRLPDLPPRPAAAGPALPIASLRASTGEEALPLTQDGSVETYWRNGPQHSRQWIAVDLGEVRVVGAVVTLLGDATMDYPRRLTIESSVDGERWHQVWDGSTVGEAVLAAIRSPREIPMAFVFDATRARYVRLRQTGEDAVYAWNVSELRVLGPPAGRGARVPVTVAPWHADLRITSRRR